MIAMVGHLAGQETADLRTVRIARFATLRACAMISDVAARFGTRASATTDHVYPSPCRSACPTGGPVSHLTRGIGGIPAAIGYHGKTAIELWGNNVDFGAIFEKLEKGRKPCRKNQSSSRPSQPSHFPLAWKATPNVLSSAQAVVWSQLKCWAPIVRALCLPVQRLACSVTTSASAVPPHAKSAARNRAVSQSFRRRGVTPAAFLRFGGDH